jgi:hypothetical protein
MLQPSSGGSPRFLEHRISSNSVGGEIRNKHESTKHKIQNRLHSSEVFEASKFVSNFGFPAGTLLGSLGTGSTMFLGYETNIGARGFEPPTCRRGDRSSMVCSVHLCLAQFCNIALWPRPLGALPRFRCEAKSRAYRALLLSIRQHCVGFVLSHRWAHANCGYQCANNKCQILLDLLRKIATKTVIQIFARTDVTTPSS